MSAAELSEHAWSLMLLATSASMVVMLMGIPLRAWFGPGCAYAAWILVPVALVASLLPRANHVAVLTFVGHSVPTVSVVMPPVPHLGAAVHPDALWTAWAVGVFAMIGLMVLRHVQCVRFLAGSMPESRHEGLRVVTSKRWPHGPATVGVFKPVIVVPADFQARYDVAEQAMVLQHEAVHVRRRDTLWTLIATLVVALAWFNPLLHLARNRFRRDQELACDDAVIRRMGARRAYAEAMLKSARPVPGLSVACGWLGHHSLQERIMMLNKPTRSPLRRGVAFTALALGIAVASAAIYATDLPNDGIDATVTMTVKQSGKTVAENIICAEQEQRISIPYERSRHDYGDLHFRVSRAADDTQWEVHDIVDADRGTDLDIHANGIYGDPGEPSSMRYIAPQDAAVSATWGRGGPDSVAVEIRVSPGCGTSTVASR